MKIEAVNYFGLDVLMTKTARNWCTALTRGYADLHILKRKRFEQLLADFPKESDKLRRKAINTMETFGVMKDDKLFNLISKHSSKSIGKCYETVYTRSNIFVKAVWTSNYKKLQQALHFLRSTNRMMMKSKSKKKSKKAKETRYTKKTKLGKRNHSK